MVLPASAVTQAEIDAQKRRLEELDNQIAGLEAELEELLEKVIDGVLPNDREALLEHVRKNRETSGEEERI